MPTLGGSEVGKNKAKLSPPFSGSFLELGHAQKSQESPRKQKKTIETIAIWILRELNHMTITLISEVPMWYLMNRIKRRVFLQIKD